MGLTVTAPENAYNDPTERPLYWRHDFKPEVVEWLEEVAQTTGGLSIMSKHVPDEHIEITFRDELTAMEFILTWS